MFHLPERGKKYHAKEASPNFSNYIPKSGMNSQYTPDIKDERSLAPWKAEQERTDGRR